MSIVKVFASSI